MLKNLKIYLGVIVILNNLIGCIGPESKLQPVNIVRPYIEGPAYVRVGEINKYRIKNVNENVLVSWVLVEEKSLKYYNLGEKYSNEEIEVVITEDMLKESYFGVFSLRAAYQIGDEVYRASRYISVID